MSAVEVAIVGAGISGLVRAHALAASREVVVVEASARAGGLLRTERVESPALQYEHGAEALGPGTEHVAALAESLGVGVARAPATARARFLVHRGALVPVPMSPPALLRTPLLSWRGKLRLLGEPWRSRVRALDGSIADFARHRLGREATAALVDPMVAGVHAGDAEQLSLRASFPQVAQMIDEHGSLFRALRARRGSGGGGLWRPEGGMQALPEALARTLGERLRLSSPVRRLVRETKGWRLELDGEALRAREVVLATPLAATRKLLHEVAPGAAAALDDMAAESLVSVVHAHRRRDVGHSLAGFGYLVSSREGLHHLGTLFSSSIDPSVCGEELVVLRTLLGGARAPELLAVGDDVIRDIVAREVGSLLGIAGAPVWSNITRYDRVLPRLDLRHPERLAHLRRALPYGLAVLGNFTDGVGVSSLVRAALG